MRERYKTRVSVPPGTPLRKIFGMAVAAWRLNRLVRRHGVDSVVDVLRRIVREQGLDVTVRKVDDDA